MAALATFGVILFIDSVAGSHLRRARGPTSDVLQRLQGWCPLSRDLQLGIDQSFCIPPTSNVVVEIDDARAGESLRVARSEASRILGLSDKPNCGLCSILAGTGPCSKAAAKGPETLRASPGFADIAPWCDKSDSAERLCSVFTDPSQRSAEFGRVVLHACAAASKEQLGMTSLKVMEVALAGQDEVAAIASRLGDGAAFSLLGMGNCLEWLHKNMGGIEKFLAQSPEVRAGVCQQQQENPNLELQKGLLGALDDFKRILRTKIRQRMIAVSQQPSTLASLAQSRNEIVQQHAEEVRQTTLNSAQQAQSAAQRVLEKKLHDAHETIVNAGK